MSTYPALYRWRPFAVVLLFTITTAGCGGTASDGQAVLTDRSSEEEQSPTTASTDQPSPTDDPDAPAEVTDDHVVDEFEALFSSDLPSGILRCMRGDPRAEPDLLTALEDVDAFLDLSFEQQQMFFEVISGCEGYPELVAAEWARELARFGFEAGPEVGECLAAAMAGEAGPLAFIGMVAWSEGRQPPESAREPMIDLHVECFPGSALAAAFLSGAGPQAEGVIDSECIDSVVSDESFLRPIWETVADSVERDPQELLTASAPLFTCLSLGKASSADFASITGVELSDQTISCIDAAAAELGFWEAALSGPNPENATQAVVFSCLTEEELALVPGQ